MTALKSSVTTQFTEGTINNGVCVLEKSAQAPLLRNQAYFKLHKNNNDNISLFSSSGQIQLVNSFLVKDVYETLEFNNVSVIKLKYPNATNVTFEIIGSLINPDNETVLVSYDGVRQQIETNVICFGVIVVHYSSSYQLWLANFDGECPLDIPSVNVDDDIPVINAELQMVVIAVLSDIVINSISIAPSPCTGFNFIIPDRNIQDIKIEFNPDRPPSLKKFGNNLVAGCTVRVFSDDPNINIQVSSGSIVSSLSSPEIMSVKESLVFDNSSLVNLTYHQRLNVSVTQIGLFFNRWNIEYQPYFLIGLGSQQLGTPENYNVVEWSSQLTYRYLTTNQVKNGQIVTTDLFNRAMESLGVISVDYQTHYQEFDFIFDYDPNILKFADSFCICTDTDGNVGKIRLAAPTMTGG